MARSFSKSISASECCQVERSKRIRTLADERPDLDFDYLLDHENLDNIKKNIENRKGIGDIHKVHHIWNEIQKFGDKKKGSAEEYSKLWHELYTEALKIPNRTHQDAPVGGEKDSIVVGTAGEKREGSGLFIAEDLINGWRSVHYPRESSGSRAYAFIGPLANIEHALLSFAVDTVRELRPDIKIMQVPDLLPLTSTQGCGVLPQSVDTHTLQYLINQDPQICLSGTAEMGIAHLLKNTTLTGQKAHWFLAKSRCYRPEVSHSAAEARLYRVHEFNKVEIFVVCEHNHSDKCLKEIVDIQKEIFGRLDFHYRVLDMASQELGAAAARKFDIEAWMPGRKYFGEVSSASNCLNYQSRRLGIKVKSCDGEIKYAHTCNGTAISSSRALITVLESHQVKNRKGWKCPKALKKYMPLTRTAPVFLKKAKKFTYDFTD